MRPRMHITITLLLPLFLISCQEKDSSKTTKIIFLHHSTGGVIWNGSASSSKKAELPLLFSNYNKENNTNYSIKEQTFPKTEPYGWNNYPYDYYNIWVKNSGETQYLEEPTLEILTKEYQIIIFKHCFPVSNIEEDIEPGNVDSDIKTISNYKAQYYSLRDKMHEFPDTKFILFTGALQTQQNISEQEAQRAKEFFTWVREVWDLPSDNIYLWDLYSLEAGGGLYLKEEFAVSSIDPHPNKDFASKVVKLLFNRIIDIIETDGSKTGIDGTQK